MKASLGKLMGWSDEPPTVSGRYVLTLRGDYFLLNVRDRGDGVLSASGFLPVA